MTWIAHHNNNFPGTVSSLVLSNFSTAPPAFIQTTMQQLHNLNAYIFIMHRLTICLHVACYALYVSMYVFYIMSVSIISISLLKFVHTAGNFSWFCIVCCIYSLSVGINYLLSCNRNKLCQQIFPLALAMW